jgi:bifunctional non-homologous end joining protein LigD
MPLVRCREPFDDPAWWFAVKLDGFRAVAFVNRGRCHLVSRNGHVFKSWPSLCDAIARSVRAKSAVLDGELVALDDAGKPQFYDRMFRRSDPYFYAFDLLVLDARDVRELPLVQRKRLLRRVVPRRSDRLRYLDGLVGRGVDLFRAVCELDLEEIVAKRLDGIYDPTATSGGR